MNLSDYRCNTPVLLIFFNRPESFAQVFEKVRQASPRTLILAQDGPRHEADKPGIAACRAIAENINWECNVIKEYSDVNLGCGMRPKSAVDRALELFERVIILEDDCIPSPTFFPYCEELLERYKDDERIIYISGLNHFETWDCGEYDYFFTKGAAIWGWATWRRAWKKHYDYYVKGIHDPYLLSLYRQQLGNDYIYGRLLPSLKRANLSASNGEQLSYWDVQWGFAKYTQNMVGIVPRCNQICNIGVGEASTHAQKLRTNRYIKYKNSVFIPTYELPMPLRHPDFCANDTEYQRLVHHCASGNFLKRVLRWGKETLLKRSHQ